MGLMLNTGVKRDYYLEPWSMIEEAIKECRKDDPYWKIWKLSIDKPLSIDSINYLVKEGWKVGESWFPPSSHCTPGDHKYIGLNLDIDYYLRDRMFFHELCHAWYGDELDSSPSSSLHYSRKNKVNLLTEWLARQGRANPDLLRHAIFSFGLEPKVYDRISYIAFKGPIEDLEKQLSFSFAEEFFKYKEITNRINMD